MTEGQLSRLDLAREVQPMPVGLKDGTDASLVVVGVIVDADSSGNRVKVSINGSAGSWMAAVPARYIVGRTAFVVRNPLRGGASEWCAGPTFPTSFAARAAVNLDDLDTDAYVGTVDVDGTTYELPVVASSEYVIDSDVWVLRNPYDGVPYLIAGATELASAAATTPPPSDPSPSDPSDLETIPTPGDEPASSVTRTATIRPTWSGTYRYDRSAYDRWNADRTVYGGRSTLYQGSGHGSGTLKGLAVFGNQITALNASEITAMSVVLRGADLSETSYPSITIQPSASGSKPSGAPSSTGTTFSGSPGRAGKVLVALDAPTRESFRTGALKGLALVGASYGAVRGTSAADGMALHITYTTPA